MIIQESLKFLSDLSNNNNREWFNDNKDRYKHVKKDFDGLAEELGKEIASFDDRVATRLMNKRTIKVFRIYKDARFAKDKPPYKLNFGAVIAPGAMESGHPGYYLHIQPNGESFIGGGLYRPAPKLLNKIREQIDQDPSELKKIISNKTFKKHFDGLDYSFDSLKTIPRGYDKDHPEAELLRLKSFVVFKQMSDDDIVKQVFFDELLEVYKALYQLNEYLERVIFSS